MRIIAVILMAVGILLPSRVVAQVPTAIAFQGHLTDPDGAPLSGQFDTTFRLYPGETGGENWRGAYVHFDGSANLFHLGVHPTSDGDRTNDVNAITITRTATPRVGIGTESPAERLHVAGRVRATEFVTTSDARFKTEVEPLRDALGAVMQLRGVSYAWIDDATAAEGDRQIGFLAQEVREILPEVVREDDEGTLSVAYSQLVPILVEAIKEQQAEIQILREEMRELVTLVRTTLMRPPSEDRSQHNDLSSPTLNHPHIKIP